MRRYDPPISPTDLDKAYAAGFVDGEGHILVTSQGTNYRGTPCFTGTVGVTQVDRAPLEWIRERWGGYLFPRAAKGRFSACWRINIVGKQAAVFCADMLPYLQVKRGQAANLIAFSDSRRGPGKVRSESPLTEAEIIRAQSFVERSKALNKKERPA